jgi:riboflavin synthase
MFSGIIESLGQLKHVEKEQSNIRLTIESPLSDQLKIDQSVAHNGICLTVVACTTTTFEVVAIDETIRKTTISRWQAGDRINLERCIALGARVDGHMVQGHVDTTGIVTDIAILDGSWKFVIQYTSEDLTVPKGSISINGVSLTVVDSAPGLLSVCIIPFTYEHTTFQYIKVDDRVNLEFDVLGKYIAAYMKHYKPVST